MSEPRAAHYGWYEIRVQHDPATRDPVIDAAGTIQRTLADTLDAIGPGPIAALLTALLIGGVTLRRRRPGTRTSRSTPSHCTSPPARCPGSVPDRAG
ncbi:hypothetical protein [Streptomyces cupreus]|uniref:hypothetical protein n=1 Tax=Streptomyces cupreus TaxID=2759956 RepID=UPI0021B485C6|nr:hypothetical protein [Streptomyces cupreus]